jgi:lysophospholipase L1-like esterase
MLASAAVLIALLSGCATSAPSSDTDPSAKGGATQGGGPSVMWVGDSVAKTEAPALEAALEAAGARFSDESSEGGGVIVDSGGDMSELVQGVWGQVSAAIEKKKPDTIVYQISTYDWGTPDQQKEGYRKLADEAASIGADLVIVSAPPVKIDDFYAPHASEMATTAASANSVAEASGGTVTFLDASALWGTDPLAEKAQRGKDGIHACQQAAASFASWFMTGFEKVSGLEPTDPKSWATGDWTSDEVFAGYDCPTGEQ